MALFGRLTGSEFLNFAGRMYGLDRETAAKRTAELLDFMQLADQPKKLVTDYSHGMQKKLAMAAAVIHGPKVLFLDEPFEGVDAIAAGTLKTMLQGMIARGATIFLTSHVLEIVERLCSHVAIIHKGRLVAQGSLEELRAGVEAQTHAGLADNSGDGSANGARPSGEKMTLEQIFLRTVGGSRPAEQELSWLG
jgi:ABC-2 type transport system ATP-binding protein